jgi:Rrf2 family transcriptional regulator, nitric oxide-sensitive transcriptional repressor
MQLTTHTDYALRLLLFVMSQAPRKVTTREVADAFGISLHHLTKVAKSLTRAGWLVSARGSGGGLQLAQHTPDVSVGEIVRYTETNCDLAECFSKQSNTCPLTTVCRLKGVLHRAQHAFFTVLNGVTLREIAGNRAEINRVLLPRT